VAVRCANVCVEVNGLRVASRDGELLLCNHRFLSGANASYGSV
jgi:hypothetical protein